MHNAMLQAQRAASLQRCQCPIADLVCPTGLCPKQLCLDCWSREDELHACSSPNTGFRGCCQNWNPLASDIRAAPVLWMRRETPGWSPSWEMYTVKCSRPLSDAKERSVLSRYPSLWQWHFSLAQICSGHGLYQHTEIPQFTPSAGKCALLRECAGRCAVRENVPAGVSIPVVAEQYDGSVGIRQAAVIRAMLKVASRRCSVQSCIPPEQI